MSGLAGIGGSVRTLYSFEELGRSTFGKKFSGDYVVEELRKAMATAAGVSGASDATAVRLENLDMVMSSVLFDESHLQVFNWLFKSPSTQPFYQWNRRNQYGSARSRIGFLEGGGPGGSLASWTRFGTYVKYLGVKRGLTHQMMLTGMAGGSQLDPVTEENRDGTLDLLEKVERGLFWFDSNIDGQIFDGIVRQVFNGSASNIPGPPTIDPGSMFGYNIIDMHGAALTRANITDIATKFFNRKVQNFANVNMFSSGDVISDLDKTLDNSDRILLPRPGGEGFITGQYLAGHQTRFGVIPFTPSVFTEPFDTKAPVVTATATISAPAAPTCTAVALSSQTTPGHSVPAPSASGNSITWTPMSNFKATADNKTYYYSASAVDASGETLATLQTGGVAVVGGQMVTVVTTRVTNALYYIIYRGLKADGSDARYIGMVAQANGSADAKFIDTNFIMAGTDTVFILERTPSNMVCAQLAPLTKMILPQEQTTFPFYLLLYISLVVKVAERQFILMNVGRL